MCIRDRYRVEREDKAGKGYVDFIFYPIRHDQDCMILELKVDHKPEEAIAQIKEKEYALRFKGKTAERKEYTGPVSYTHLDVYKRQSEWWAFLR